MQLLNFVPDLGFDTKPLTGGYSVTLKKSGKMNIREVYRGKVSHSFFWIQTKYDGYISDSLVFLQDSETSLDFLPRYDENDDSTTLTVDFTELIPCSGFFTQRGEGMITGYAYKFDIPLARDLGLMVLRSEARSRGGRPLSISISRPTLSISQGSANATVSLKQGIDGELVCEGNVSGSGFRGARIELVRSSSVGTSRVTERIAEVQGTGEISGTWKPFPSSFEDDFLLAFHPGKLGQGEVYQITNALKAKQIEGPMGLIRERMENFAVVSDGTGPNYLLRLVLDRHLRGDLYDQVEITIS